MRKISLCITTWKRYPMLLRSFEQVINDERIGEIVISSDADEGEQWEQLKEYCKYQSKIKLVRNDTRLGVYGNKNAAVKAASFDWVIIFDSDNVINPDYINGIFSNIWSPNQVIAPSFARPSFNYTAFQGQVISKANVASFIGQKKFDCLLNTMNYFINRGEYLKIWQPKDVNASDTIYFNSLWLKAGNTIYIDADVQYEHLIHNGSNYQLASNESKQDCQRIENELKLMK